MIGRITRILKAHKIGTQLIPTRKISQLLRSGKDHFPRMTYRVPYTCGKVYIGMTTTKEVEKRRPTRPCQPKVIAECEIIKGHQILFNQIEAISEGGRGE